MNTLFALAILVAYVVIHAKKEKMPAVEWAKKNWLTVVCAGAILLASLLLPKAALMAVMSWVGTPILLALALKWGAVSLLSNAFSSIAGWIKGRLA